MPVIVIGADTTTGDSVIRRFLQPNREVRAFVTDPVVGQELRSLGAKVAIGDLSDESHIHGAAIGCFTAVMIEEATNDDRERHFADTPSLVVRVWINGIMAAKVTRVIWVGNEETAPISNHPGLFLVAADDPQLVEKVYEIDNAQSVESLTSSKSKSAKNSM